MTATTTAPVSGARRLDPVVVAFAGYPVLWLFGAGVLAWPLAGGLAVLSLTTSSRPTRFPRFFLLWLAFIGWMLLSGVTLEEPQRAAAFAYRATMYLSATALFLYVYNTPRELLPDRTVIRALTWLWVATVVGGVIGATMPNLQFTSLVERLLPQGVLNIGLVKANVQLDFAGVSTILGQPLGRPNAPFTWTNAWGSNLALLFPAAIAARRMRPSPGYRTMVGLLAVASIFPIITSLNRGMWISLLVGVLVIALRFAARGDARSLTTIFVVGMLMVGGLAATNLDGIITARAERGHSNEGRLALYQDSLALTASSPLIGFATPQPREGDDGPSVGTHGQVWLLLVSHGVPGAALYLAFMVALFLAMRRWRSELGVFCQAIIVMSLVQTLVYEQLPSQLQIVMVVGALALRASAPAPALADRGRDLGLAAARIDRRPLEARPS